MSSVHYPEMLPSAQIACSEMSEYCDDNSLQKRGIAPLSYEEGGGGEELESYVND